MKRSTPFLCCLSLFLFLTAVPLRAQNSDAPVFSTMTVGESIFWPNGAPYFPGVLEWSVTDETGAAFGRTLYNGQINTTVTGSLTGGKFVPFKTYTVSARVYQGDTAHLSFKMNGNKSGVAYICGYQLSSVELSPTGTPGFVTQGTATVGSVTYTTYSFTLRFALPGTTGGDLEPEYLPAGAASSLAADKPVWFLGLGRFRDGNPAGVVGFRQQDLTSSTLFTRNALYYGSYYPNIDNEVSTYGIAGNLMQVRSPEVLLDMPASKATSTSYQIDVYSCQANAVTRPNTNVPYTFTGSPFVSYVIAKISGALVITRTEDGIIWETKLAVSGATWTMTDWHVQGTSLNSYVTTAYTSNTAADVTQTGPASGLVGYTDTPFAWSKAFATNDTGQNVLTEKKFGATETTPAVSNFGYYSTTSASTGAYKNLLQWSTNPDGTWQANTYYVGSGPGDTVIPDGQVKRTYRPWLDNNSATAPAAHAANPSTTNDAYDDYAYTYLVKGTGPQTYLLKAWLPASINSYAPGGTLLKRSTWDYNGYVNDLPTTNPNNLNGYNIWSSTQKDYSDATHYLLTKRLFYMGNVYSPKYFDDKPVSVTYPNGRKDSYAYFNGTWDSATNAFTASLSGNDRLVLCIHGQVSGGTNVTSWTQSAINWELDPLHMVAGTSTVSESVIDASGRAVFSGENIYTATGTLERLTGVQSVYDSHGRLTDTVDIIRSIGDTKHKVHRTYNAMLLDTETAADGVVTQYQYDGLLRLTQKTIGSTGTAPYPAKIQSSIYDGANRPVSASSCSCGTSTIYYYDSAGRVTAKSDPSPNGTTSSLLTGYSYNSVTRSTTTSPAGATTISTQYADGRPKSVTGTAQPPVYYDYAANSTGMLVTQKHDNDTAMANGWSQDQSDLLGRVVKHSTPTYGWAAANSKVVDLTSTYDFTTGLLTAQNLTYRATTTALAPTHLYVYDGAGRLTDDGLDLNGSTTLTAASNDRFTHYDNTFVKDTAGWTNVATNSIYATSTATQVARTVTRLTGFNSGTVDSTYGLQVGEVTATDVNNQTSTQKEYVLSSALKRYTTVTLPGATNAGWTVSVNGYASESQAVSGARTKNEYDAVGRIATVRSRWNGTNTYAAADTTTYFGDTKFVQTQVVNGITTNFAYAWSPTTGTRQVTTTDIAGNSSYTLYNAMGLPSHVGGTATSPVQFGYDAVGRRLSMTTWRAANYTEANWPAVATGDTTTWTVEPATGLITSKIAADSSHVDFTYTPLGQPLTRINARNQTTTYAYYDGSTGTNADVSYRTQELKSITYPAGSQTPNVYFTYNRSGLPNVINDATSIGTYDVTTTGTNAGHTFGYDSTNSQPLRVMSEALSGFYGSRVQTQKYDTAFRPAGFLLGAAVDSSSDLSQVFTYNAASGLPDTLVTSPANQTPASKTYTFNWNTNSQFFTGYTTPVTGGTYALAYDYQTTTNLRSQVKSTFAGTTVTQFDPAYNTLGQIKSVQQSGSAFNDYYLSATNPLQNFVTNSFGYDAMGQLQTKQMYRATSGAPVDSDKLPGRSFEYRYDAMGNRKSAGDTGTSSTTAGQGDDDFIVNQLNQYSSKENNFVRVSGTAAAGANVTVAGAPAATKRDRSWGAALAPANATGPVTGTATVYASLPGGGAGGADLVGTNGKPYFVPARTQDFGYDLDGNLINDGVWIYAYDAENRLISMTNQLPAGVGHKRWNLSFTYDYLGRRVQKIATNLDPTTDSTPSYTRRYLYNGWNLVAEFSFNSQLSTLSLARSYTWGLDLAGSFSATGGVGALMQITDHNVNKNYFTAYDHNGNVAALTRDNGTVAAAYEYSPFGEPMRADALDPTDTICADNPFRFSTKYTDAESGLVYYGKRYYSATLGRFINRDPIQESGGLNLYGFVGNNPVSNVDVLGMQTRCYVVKGVIYCVTDDGFVPPETTLVWGTPRSSGNTSVSDNGRGGGGPTNRGSGGNLGVSTSYSSSNFRPDVTGPTTVLEKFIVTPDRFFDSGYDYNLREAVRSGFNGQDEFGRGGSAVVLPTFTVSGAPNKTDPKKLPGCSELRKQVDSGKSPKLTAQSFIENENAFGFVGDNRGFTNSPADGYTDTYRTSASISWDGSSGARLSGEAGITRLHGNIYSGQATPIISGDIQIERNGPNGGNYNRYIQFAQLSASASDPFFQGFAPSAAHSINAVMNFETGMVSGSVNYTAFPALQVFVGDQSVFKYSANAANKNPLWLFATTSSQFSSQVCDPTR